MIAHYLKIALRHFVKHKVISLINVLGLSIGMACSILMLLFVAEERSFDTFHTNADRIYRLATDFTPPGQPIKEFAVSAPPTAPALLADFSEIEQVVRFHTYFEGATPGKVSIRYRPLGEQQFYEMLMWADASVFDVFSFELVEGNPETALDEPFTVVITEEMAEKYFENGKILGERITVDGGFDVGEYTITGVVRSPPKNSSIPFDMLASFQSLENMSDERVILDNWYLFDNYSFLMLREGASSEAVAARFEEFIGKHAGEVGQDYLEYHLEPLTDIHLRSDRLIELAPGGNVTYVYGTAVLALFIIVLACINFMNLSTARSASRAKDVGMRKVAGAYRSQLVVQFLGESMLVALISLVVAVIMVELALPSFSAFVDRDLELLSSGDWTVFAGFVVLTLAVGLAAGAYPAFFLSAFQPVSVLKGTLQAGVRSSLGRKVLVTFQFSISIALMIGAVVVYQQLAYMRDQQLGWNAEQLIGISIRDAELRQRYDVVRQELSRRPSVSAVTFSSLVMGHEAPNISVLPEGFDDFTPVSTVIGDPGYLDTFGLEIVAGRNLRHGSESDLKEAFLVNEAAVEHFGWGEPGDALGKHLQWATWKEGQVVGVFKNFHYRPLRHAIRPMVMHIRPLVFHYCYVRVGGDDVPGTIEFLEEAWKTLSPGHPFEYFFVDEAFDRFYRNEERLGEIFGAFSLIAVFVACLGLFGLASFVAEQRTREIGIRKVHGASAEGIVLLLSKEFTWLVILANAVAWPLAWLGTRRWLEDFAYRAEISLAAFVAAGLVALVIAWLTVSFQSLRAATMSPVRSLRYE